MKNKKIILLVVFSLLGSFLLASVIGVHFLMIKGYSTPEDLLCSNPYVPCKEIYGLVESRDRVLAVYEDRTAIRRAIIYKEDGLYNLYKYDTTPLVYEMIETGSVFVRDVKGKFTIEVSDIIDGSSIISVTDSLNSDFQYTTISLPQGEQQQWFLAIDEIPKDYCIYVDDIKIPVPQPE